MSAAKHTPELPETVSVRALHLQLEGQRWKIEELQAELTALRTAHLDALLVALDTIRTIAIRPDPDMEQEAVDLIRAAITRARGES